MLALHVLLQPVVKGYTGHSQHQEVSMTRFLTLLLVLFVLSYAVDWPQPAGCHLRASQALTPSVISPGTVFVPFTGSVSGCTCRTPVVAAVASNFINLGLDFTLIFGLGWGVAGAAIATSVSQYASLLVMCRMLLKKDMLQAEHLRQPPSKAQVAPLLRVS